jgi:cholest-4-en-3-one 26-monooxygenase
MAGEQADLDTVDLMDSDLHAGGPPHALFGSMRARCPVQRGESAGRPYWSVTGDAEVTTVDRDSARFSSYRGGIFLNPDQVAPLELLRNVLLFMDPPQHSSYRRILSSVFTPRSVRAMEGTVGAATSWPMSRCRCRWPCWPG